MRRINSLSSGDPGTISGIVFDDLNGNGVRESGEPGLANQRVYIDANFSNSFDKNEPSRLNIPQV